MRAGARPAGFAAYSVEGCRARIAERNDALNAVLEVLAIPQVGPGVREDAPLAGIPYTLKDTWDTAGITTTGGSWRHRARVPEVSSHAHRALAGAGAVLLGKSNLCDLAFSAESDNHLRGRGRPVRNPHDPTRTAGGSTGGGAAAVADGMAAFDWGTDFGGSIRGPSAFCGVVGMRLSHAVWPVGREHFPRISPFFWDFCGMGPLATSVQNARTITRAVRSALRKGDEHATMDERRVVIYAPDAAHDGEWPTFTTDISRLLASAGIACEITRDLPPPTAVNELFTSFLASHLKEFSDSEELPLREGIPAVLLALATGGRLDKRVHPNTAMLLAGTALMALRYRDKARAVRELAKLRADIASIWQRGTLIVSPTCTSRAPKHGATAWAYRLMTFCKLGNMTDATALALPFGTYPPLAAKARGLLRVAGRSSASPSMPRSLQILGPPGSEESVLALAERLEARIATTAQS